MWLHTLTRSSPLVLFIISWLVLPGRDILSSASAFQIQNLQARFGRPSLLYAKRRKGGGSRGGNTGGGKGGGGSPDRLVAESEYVKVQEDGSDAWRCADITDLLRRGGVGVLPTDTGYGFVTPIDSKAGLERILKIKGYEGCKKPLSLLVPDLATIDTYCLGINKSTFKLLKKNLPGPYTFILPASSNLPKMMFLDSKGKKHSWDRKSLGVRIPEDQVLHYVQEELGGTPLLVSSLPNPDEDDEYEGGPEGPAQLNQCQVDVGSSWCSNVDFIVDAGERPVDGSTIYDLCGEPTLVRQGLGAWDLI